MNETTKETPSDELTRLLDDADKFPFGVRCRIAIDDFSGYEVQVWRWWFPVWVVHGANTHRTLDDARRYIVRSVLRPVVEEWPRNTNQIGGLQ
jgi:hypothetical protein